MLNRVFAFARSRSQTGDVNSRRTSAFAKGPFERRMWSVKNRRQRLEVQAVDDKGLVALLKRLGVYGRIGTDARCVRCGNLVTIDSIEAIFPEDGEVRFICTNAKCATALVTPDVR